MIYDISETDLISAPFVITEAQLVGQSFAGYTQTHAGLKHTKQLMMTTQNIREDVKTTRHREAAQQEDGQRRLTLATELKVK